MHLLLFIAALIGPVENGGQRWHSGGKSASNRDAGDRGQLNPLGESPAFSTNLNDDVVALVPVLLAPGGPSAITGRVVAIIHYPIEGVSRSWPCAHVVQERLKVAPPPADCDPAPAIVGELPMTSVPASGEHVSPGPIFRGFLSVCAVPMLANLAKGYAHISPKASAGLHGSVPQKRAHCIALTPTLTETPPGELTPHFLGRPSHSETAKNSTYHRSTHLQNNTRPLRNRKEA